MTLGNLTTLRERLGGKVGLKYCCAVKKAAGYGGSRWFNLDAVVAWFSENGKGFKMTSVYPSRYQSTGKKKGRPMRQLNSKGAHNGT
jgi:hypothetical protein